MPTILLLLGWRLFFYANEGNEPVHIHCKNGNMECKFWIDVENFDIQEAFVFNMSQRDKRQIRKIIFEHFEYIVEQWQEFQKKEKIMRSYHAIDEIKMENGVLSLRVDGQFIRKALLEISPILANASEKEISTYEVSPSGYGISWPLIDEDISIDGLLGVMHSPAQKKKSA